MITLKRKKTSEPNVWDLEHDGTIVGQAKAEYKSDTQRTWTANITVSGKAYSCVGLFSIKRVIADLERQANAVETKQKVTA